MQQDPRRFATVRRVAKQPVYPLVLEAVPRTAWVSREADGPRPVVQLVLEGYKAFSLLAVLPEPCCGNLLEAPLAIFNLLVLGSDGLTDGEHLLPVRFGMETPKAGPD